MYVFVVVFDGTTTLNKIANRPLFKLISQISMNIFMRNFASDLHMLSCVDLTHNMQKMVSQAVKHNGRSIFHFHAHIFRALSF